MTDVLQRGPISEIGKRTEISRSHPTLNIVVFGGTGAQGTPIVRDLLSSKVWNVRIPIKNPEAEADRVNEFVENGADVVKCDWNDFTAVERCLDGAYACYLNLNYFDPNLREREEIVAKQIMQIAKAKGVMHMIYSALPQVDFITHGDVRLPQFSMKGKAMDFCKTLGFRYLSFVLPSFYYSNWFAFFPPRKLEDGSLLWSIPGEGNGFSSYDACDDTGRCVRAILENPEVYNGKLVCIQGDHLTVREAMDEISKCVNLNVKCQFLDYENYCTLGGHRENAEMFKWFDKYGFFGPCAQSKDCVLWNKERDPNMRSFSEWLQTGEYKSLLETCAGIKLED
jgi:nucleoside-diphosphate-sugar epimerase